MYAANSTSVEQGDFAEQRTVSNISTNSRLRAEGFFRQSTDHEIDSQPRSHYDRVVTDREKIQRVSAIEPTIPGIQLGP